MDNLLRLLGILFIVLFLAGVSWLAYGSYEYMKNKSQESSIENSEVGVSDSERLAMTEEAEDMDDFENDEEDEFLEDDEDLLEDEEVDELLEADAVLDEIESVVMEAEEATEAAASNVKDKVSSAANNLASAGSATLDKAKAGVSDATEKAKAGISSAATQAKAGVEAAADKAKAGVSEFTEKSAKTSSKAERKDIPTNYDKPVNLSPKDLYFVITGSFTIAENAEKEVKAMRKKGYDKAETIQFSSTKYLSVCVGRFDKRADANRMAAKLKNDSKIDAYVHKRRLK